MSIFGLEGFDTITVVKELGHGNFADFSSTFLKFVVGN